MSIHPNAMLLLALTPDNLARKTHRDIMTEVGIEDADDDITIGKVEYHHNIMEEDYNSSYQISLPEGSICLWDLVTYGYGEKIEWDKLAAQKEELEEWAKGICERHHCSYKIYVSANYW